MIVYFIASENLHGNGNNLQTQFFFLHPHPPPILFTFHVLTISAMTEAQKLCVTNVLMNQIIILQTVYKAFFMCHKIRENWMFVTFYTCIKKKISYSKISFTKQMWGKKIITQTIKYTASDFKGLDFLKYNIGL